MIGFELIEVSHDGVNIVKCVDGMIQEFSVLDKLFFVTSNDASSNAIVMLTLSLCLPVTRVSVSI